MINNNWNEQEKLTLKELPIKTKTNESSVLTGEHSFTPVYSISPKSIDNELDYNTIKYDYSIDNNKIIKIKNSDNNNSNDSNKNNHNHYHFLHFHHHRNNDKSNKNLTIKINNKYYKSPIIKSAVPVTCPIIDSSILDLYAQNRIPSPSSFSHFTFTPSTSMETTPTHSPLQSPSLSSSSVTSFDIYNNLSTPIIYTTTSNFSPSLLSVTATMKTGSSPLQSRVTTLNNIDDISSTSSVSNINFLSPTVTRSATCVKKRFNIKINKSSVLNKNKSFSDKDNIPYYSFKSIVESNDLNPTYSKIHL